MVFADLLAGIDEILRRVHDCYADLDDGGVMDEPATARQLEAHVQRGVDAGALSPDHVRVRTSREVGPGRRACWRRSGRFAAAAAVVAVPNTSSREPGR